MGWLGFLLTNALLTSFVMGALKKEKAVQLDPSR
jgi:hypothetical protein